MAKKQYRGNGLSSILKKKLIECAKLNGCLSINLEVSSSNEVAINLYKKFGFKQVGIRSNYYGKSDALLFTCEIPFLSTM